MSYLSIEQPDVPALEVKLVNEKTSLGRADDNDVVLVADEVSRHHAVITRRGDGYLLRDLESLNGTYVNRQQVIERILSDKDEVWLGSKCRMVFRYEYDAAAQEASSVEQDLERIREDMDRVGNSMTLIGKQSEEDLENTKTMIGASGHDVHAMGRAFRRLSALYKASNETSRLIASNADLPTRLAKTLDLAIEVTEAGRGFLMLRDEATGGLQVHVAREMGQDLRESSPSMGIAGRAANYGEPVLMRERGSNKEYGGRDSVIAQRIQSAMSVPLKIEGRVLGAIYVDTRNEQDSFDEEDLELFASMASQMALAIENVRLYERMVAAEKKRADLGRFLSPAIVEAIMQADQDLELGGRKQMVTTMFCDIRGFTPIAERLAPGELVDMLNTHFTAMVDILFAYQGTLDKYIGDEIMAVFGAPIEQEDDAERAIQAALAMQQKNRELNEMRAREGMPVFEMGIGICSGEVIAGHVGSPERMEFTVVGDRVNVARRLCSLAEAGQLVVSEASFERAKELIEARPIGTVNLKGKANPEKAFEVLRLRQQDEAAITQEPSSSE